MILVSREPFWYKDRLAESFFEDEIATLTQPLKHSMVGKFFRMPRLNEIQAAFKGIGLVGAYKIRWLDYKHILIHLTNEHDLNRFWTRQAHLFQKSALIMIAKIVRRPLFVDEATTNGSRLGITQVCIEYECQKPPMDQVWIVTRDRATKTVIGGFTQKVEFSKLSKYCSHCYHVGHSVSTCMVLGYRPKKRSEREAGQDLTLKEKKEPVAVSNRFGVFGEMQDNDPLEQGRIEYVNSTIAKTKNAPQPRLGPTAMASQLQGDDGLMSSIKSRSKAIIAAIQSKSQATAHKQLETTTEDDDGRKQTQRIATFGVHDGLGGQMQSGRIYRMVKRG
ncbi:Uncharacterized protein TCM_040289 [Theobroma cacao]|uniref:DUF4283 domain-containing protein n=1 Tax=Theobroma cacao TaxID=3641 RepID=A0A061GSA1_THECC|nr:Uncharacterized protein TCM_040289 [Theobroma cacao]